VGIASVLGIALIAVSFSTATRTDRILFLGLYLVLLFVTVFQVNYSIRAFALLFMVFTVGVNSILAWGPWLDGSAFFIAFIVLSALLFDQRVDIMALLLSVFTFTLLAVLQQLGIYQLSAPNVPATTFIDWVSYTIDFSITSAIIIIAINQLKREFAHVIEEMQNTFKMLTAERAQLESRVHERTDELETRAAQLRSSATISRTIAEKLDISIKTVENHMGKALKLLRSKLVDFLPLLFILLEL
jgi:hypothetical protein